MQYYFIETEPMPVSFRDAGYPDYSLRPYVIQAWKDETQYEKALTLARTVDVALLDGYESLSFEIERYKKNRTLLSFEISERWCKRGIINFFSPRFLNWFFHYRRTFRKCNVYKLCCSAFVPNDMYKVGAFVDKCYKWAYFTKTPTLNIEDVINSRQKHIVRIIWCARFIPYKHPELVVQAAKLLKTKGYQFEINMFGGGELQTTIKDTIYRSNLDDVINIKGNAPNEVILSEMRNHHIFLFTSDRNEGWGAVVNEALSNGCAVVGDENIGAIPFLVQHGKNGRIYKTNDVNSIVEELSFYFDNPKILSSNCLDAYKTMTDMWSPHIAADRLFQLIESIQKGLVFPMSKGPCSKAFPIKNRV